jgi:hypothetical protein
MDAARARADAVLDEDPGLVEVLGIDEVRRGRPRWRPADPALQSPTPDPAPPEPVGSEPDAVELVVPQRESAKARVLADRWHVGFVDIGGGQGMLGQVEGRTADDVAYWLAMHTPAWRDRTRYVAIDMCTVFVSAVRRYLPNATIVVDHFHVVKLGLADELRGFNQDTSVTLCYVDHGG